MVRSVLMWPGKSGMKEPEMESERANAVMDDLDRCFKPTIRTRKSFATVNEEHAEKRS